MNTKLHAVTDQNGRPLSSFMTAGQIPDRLLLSHLPRRSRHLLAMSPEPTQTDILLNALNK
ncbi:hypothetical protein GCM10007872_23350 [Gluconobacter sphaericus NBRC 12467]|uniref:Transposase IS4-like domain-containing protein n=1 Tax=Gluconobacter sphaericus NBRC 12467 TaxID=1307951 RepID=A0AA37SK76_9PROT|nr:hypothetical protein AA12467_2794 [Gluconobacter sphaericus NBRC 12467]GLQ85426.1 hypothetical protein GCM10007872_23350 [Gluconobacter sphaericus NBRC 12467]